jgi:hypothetical protein
MTTGALIFARNNEHTDYVAMAHWSAKNIERHLSIPTHIVTDDSRTDSGIRSFANLGTVSWHNTNRMDAYQASPWDCTLLLDADYVVATDQLKVLLDVDQDFLAHRWSYDVTQNNDFSGLNYFGANCMPQWWATVVVFRRSRHAEFIFQSMAMIRDHWSHYRDLYKISGSLYRNDHAMSIALGMVNGHVTNSPGIPWQLATVMPDHQLSQLDTDRYRIDYVNTQGQTRWVELRQDFHCMNKKHLGDIVASNT